MLVHKKSKANLHVLRQLFFVSLDLALDATILVVCAIDAQHGSLPLAPSFSEVPSQLLCDQKPRRAITSAHSSIVIPSVYLACHAMRRTWTTPGQWIMGSIYHYILYCLSTSVMTRSIDSLEIRFESYTCAITQYGSLVSMLPSWSRVGCKKSLSLLFA